MSFQDLSATEIAQKAQVLLVETFNVAKEKMHAEASLSDELDVDSIDMIELLSSLNDEFSLDLTPFDFEGCQTLGQFLQRLVESQSKAP